MSLGPQTLQPHSELTISPLQSLAGEWHLVHSARSPCQRWVLFLRREMGEHKEEG